VGSSEEEGTASLPMMSESGFGIGVGISSRDSLELNPNSSLTLASFVKERLLKGSLKLAGRPWIFRASFLIRRWGSHVGGKRAEDGSNSDYVSGRYFLIVNDTSSHIPQYYQAIEMWTCNMLCRSHRYMAFASRVWSIPHLQIISHTGATWLFPS
jgi:hypothetical protein